MARAFASAGDLAEKQISFTEVGEGLWAFTAEGDPNSGVIIGDDCVMVVEAQATPLLANKVIEKVRSVTDKPITHLVLTHYHAVRVLGSSAFDAQQIIMSETARSMVAERGQEDWDSEFQRMPRLFEGHESIPGLTWPTTTFSGRMTVYLGERRVDILQVGRAHIAGDAVIWVPDEQGLFTGDIVEYHSACYCGDGHFLNWGGTLDFITPKLETSRLFRDAVLDLAETQPMAQPLVNSGRLSLPHVVFDSPLQSPDPTGLPTRTRPGSPAVDAPTGDGWLLARLGDRFQLLALGIDVPGEEPGLEIASLPAGRHPLLNER